MSKIKRIKTPILLRYMAFIECVESYNNEKTNIGKSIIYHFF